jgi:hypothetical protein
MNGLRKMLAASVMLLLPLAANAADTAAQSGAPPPPRTPVYPCWDMMQDGKMMPMRGMWQGGGPGGPQGGWMMMNAQDVDRMQKEIEALRKQVMEMQNRPPKE